MRFRSRIRIDSTNGSSYTELPRRRYLPAFPVAILRTATRSVESADWISLSRAGAYSPRPLRLCGDSGLPCLCGCILLRGEIPNTISESATLHCGKEMLHHARRLQNH